MRSVAHAAVILGRRALRNLVLCIAVRDALKGTRVEGFDHAQFAEDSLRRAVAAAILAESAGLDRDEAFTAGLLQDFGLLALFVVQPHAGVCYADLRRLDPDCRLEHEREHFCTGHDGAGALLAGQWELPQQLRDALACHHARAPEPSTPLAKVLAAADWAGGGVRGR